MKPLISKCSMIPAWHQLVPISGHVEESETARKLQLYATSIKTSVSTRLLIVFSWICVRNFMEIGHLISKLWSKNQFQMKKLGFRSDNPGKKGWDSLSDLVQRGSPLSPNAMLIRVMLPEAAPGRPTLIDGGGEGYDKWGVRRLL